MSLRVSDRCDRCGAQAFVLAMKNEHDLLFCAHHGSQHWDALVVDGWDIVDERGRINLAPSTSASK